MKKIYVLSLFGFTILLACISFGFKINTFIYTSGYKDKLLYFTSKQQSLLQVIEKCDLRSTTGKQKVREQINEARNDMKALDFWFRYLEPTLYKKVNGPLPVEWETEVFEKFEKPYKREGAGLTLAALYLDENDIRKDSLLQLVRSSVKACETYGVDSITSQLQTYHHFFLCNRLYLLNLAAIYTTGFECPDTSKIIPELQVLLKNTSEIYRSFNESFPGTQLSEEYLSLYNQAIQFAESQPGTYSNFDHFSFIRDYVNPLFALNQNFIKQYRVSSKSFVDYTLNKSNSSIFSKALYNGQNPKGIFLRVNDPGALAEIDHVGKLLFYDPILSQNNSRSCNSCHKSTEYFTDTAVATSLQINGRDHLLRNAPTLLNAKFNHLVMLDGKHLSLQNQLKDVMTNPLEMGSNEQRVLKKILSCKEYKDAFTRLLAYTPQEPTITLDHIVSAITFYYSKFSNYYSPFDNAMNENKHIDVAAKRGFNLFMSKAQCATCHFVPQFNGVKPPYVSSEFEVLGVPADKKYKQLSADKGRYQINSAAETLHAIRTGSIRNADHTKPYMHNGVFSTMNEVIDFYDNGGGIGHGLLVPNQTLSSDSLHLLVTEKADLLAFISSMNEQIEFEEPPVKLPTSAMAILNKRKVGGAN
ncbi:MAG: cytochrome c peroxidase [Ferruginibacter sp.]